MNPHDAYPVAAFAVCLVTGIVLVAEELELPRRLAEWRERL